MAIFLFKPSTAGERLYLYVVNQIIGSECATELNATKLMQIGNRADGFSQYFFGFACSNIFTRLIKKAKRVIDDDVSDPPRVIVRYIERSLEIGLREKYTSKRMAALAIDAIHESNRPIPKSVSQALANRRGTYCYICGNEVRSDSMDPSNLLALEHIWPSSLGGNSVVDNLLPACSVCNCAKADMLLWHSAYVAGFCLKPEPSEEEMKHVQRSHKIAVYMKMVFDLANSSGTTLKDAAITLGPVDMTAQRSVDPDDSRDFFNFSFA